MQSFVSFDVFDTTSTIDICQEHFFFFFHSGDSVGREIVSSALWISVCGILTPIHQHALPNKLVKVEGLKRWWHGDHRSVLINGETRGIGETRRKCGCIRTRPDGRNAISSHRKWSKTVLERRSRGILFLLLSVGCIHDFFFFLLCFLFFKFGLFLRTSRRHCTSNWNDFAIDKSSTGRNLLPSM